MSTVALLIETQRAYYNSLRNDVPMSVVDQLSEMIGELAWKVRQRALQYARWTLEKDNG